MEKLELPDRNDDEEEDLPFIVKGRRRVPQVSTVQEDQKSVRQSSLPPRVQEKAASRPKSKARGQSETSEKGSRSAPKTVPNNRTKASRPPPTEDDEEGLSEQSSEDESSSPQQPNARKGPGRPQKRRRRDTSSDEDEDLSSGNESTAEQQVLTTSRDRYVTSLSSLNRTRQ